MRIDLGGVSYSYGCRVKANFFLPGTRYGSGEEGPSLDANTNTTDTCDEWPQTQPRLSLQVSFRGFLPSQGIPAGRYDLSDPSALDHVTLQLSVESRAEVPAGASMPYVTYSPSRYIPEGIEALPGASGTIVVTKVAGTNFSTSLPGGLHEITLTNVVLPQSSGVMPEMFPTTVTIADALLYW